LPCTTRRSPAPALVAILILALTACGRSEPPDSTPDLAVLAQGAEGYAEARPGVELEFPRDHGPHPDYRIEWWYLVANLQDADGRPYGAQWTLFRYAVQPPGTWRGGSSWLSEQVFMVHFAITTPDDHVAFQRYARGGDHGGPNVGLAQAGVQAEPFMAWLDDWRLGSVGAEWLPLELRAQQDDYAIDLRLEGSGPLVLQGEQGFSQKHPGGEGSHYYSQPFLAASGRLRIDGRDVPVTGQAWLDREWGSRFLQPDQAGWDWFALHLDSGEKLMLFRWRARQGNDYHHGVLIAADGRKTALQPSELHFEVLAEQVVAGRHLPLHWRIELAELGRSLEVEALHPEQWMEVDFPYWEGVVTVRGDDPGSRGRGYLELTGYARR
jgi:predicted secreted hydrolase